MATFSIVDYVIFSLVLAFSAFIGLFHACTGGRQKTTKEFLVADKKMRFIPVGLSLLASFMSAIALLGTSAEIYSFGTMFWMIGISYFIMTPISAHLFLPVFYRLSVTSVYEYLQLRFSLAARLIGCLAYIAYMIMYMAVVMYAPALALNAVTGLNIWASVLSVGVICTFYTSLGGMKAVIWTDVFQTCIMFAGLLAIIIQGSIAMGGFGEIWRINEEGGRVQFFNFDPDPTVRHTFWSLSIGGAITWLGNYGCNQLSVQRYLSCPTERDAKLALYLNMPLLLCIVSLIILCGMVIFAAFAGCDPIKLGLVARADQLLAYYVIEEFAFLPGVAGLFVAAIFSGSLSTLSSGLNCLAAVTLADIVRPVIKDLSDHRAAMVVKIIACSYGGITIGMAFAASGMGPILPLAIGLMGMIGGPLLGLFSMGIFLPWTNNKGALVGVLSGFLITIWIGVGKYFYPPPIVPLPTNTDSCLVEATLANVTLAYSGIMTTDISNVTMTVNAAAAATRPAFAKFHSISYLWYSATTASITIVVGVIVSLITGFNRLEDMDPKLLCPIYQKGFFRKICGSLGSNVTDDNEYSDYCRKNLNGDLPDQESFLPNSSNGVEKKKSFNETSV